MDDYLSTKSLVLHGCRLASELESNMDKALEKTGHGARVCHEIAKIFGRAGERLRDQTSLDTSLHEWLAKSNGLIKHRADPVQPGSVQGTNTRQVSMDWRASSQRSRRRRDDGETRIVRMVAPQIGNTEIPPDDGYTWRKYGQKEIMGKQYPRSYYRCTHQKQFNCPAKKQVQRDDRDPFTFEVMYRGRHTCHLSATAPSTLPPHDNMSMSHDHHHLLPPALGSWLSIQAGLVSGPHGPVLEFPVVDMADAMFNSGSSSTSNSMDFLFAANSEDHKRISDHAGNKKMVD